MRHVENIVIGTPIVDPAEYLPQTATIGSVASLRKHIIPMKDICLKSL